MILARIVPSGQIAIKNEQVREGALERMSEMYGKLIAYEVGPLSHRTAEWLLKPHNIVPRAVRDKIALSHRTAEWLLKRGGTGNYQGHPVGPLSHRTAEWLLKHRGTGDPVPSQRTLSHRTAEWLLKRPIVVGEIGSHVVLSATGQPSGY